MASGPCDDIYKWFDFTVYQLKSVARRNNIPRLSTMKKKQIIQKLESNNVPVPRQKPSKKQQKAKPKKTVPKQKAKPKGPAKKRAAKPASKKPPAKRKRAAQSGPKRKRNVKAKPRNKRGKKNAAPINIEFSDEEKELVVDDPEYFDEPFQPQQREQNRNVAPAVPAAPAASLQMARKSTHRKKPKGYAGPRKSTNSQLI